jgi:hypothetical protein
MGPTLQENTIAQPGSSNHLGSQHAVPSFYPKRVFYSYLCSSSERLCYVFLPFLLYVRTCEMGVSPLRLISPFQDGRF